MYPPGRDSVQVQCAGVWGAQVQSEGCGLTKAKPQSGNLVGCCTPQPGVLKKDQQGRRGVRTAFCSGRFIHSTKLVSECGDALLTAYV